MAVLLQDDFNRANSTNVIGSPQVGGPYTVRAGTWGINSNQAYTSVSTANSIVTAPCAFNVEISCNVGVPTTTGGPVFRYLDSTNYWTVAMSSAQGGLSLNRSGVWFVDAPAGTVVTGSLVKVIAYGNTIYVYCDNKLVIVLEDIYMQTSAVHAGLRINSNTGPRLDNLLAQDSVDPISTSAGELSDITWVTHDYNPAGSLYKGRDTAVADEGNVP